MRCSFTYCLRFSYSLNEENDIFYEKFWSLFEFFPFIIEMKKWEILSYPLFSFSIKTICIFQFDFVFDWKPTDFLDFA